MSADERILLQLCFVSTEMFALLTILILLESTLEQLQAALFLSLGSGLHGLDVLA